MHMMFDLIAGICLILVPGLAVACLVLVWHIRRLEFRLSPDGGSTGQIEVCPKVDNSTVKHIHDWQPAGPGGLECRVCSLSIVDVVAPEWVRDRARGRALVRPEPPVVSRFWMAEQQFADIGPNSWREFE